MTSVGGAQGAPPPPPPPPPPLVAHERTPSEERARTLTLLRVHGGQAAKRDELAEARAEYLETCVDGDINAA